MNLNLVRAIALVSTILLQLLLLFALKLLDGFILIVLIFAGFLALGIYLKTNTSTTQKAKDVGWGMIYGTLVSFAGIIAFIIWLAFNFPV